MKMLIKRMMVFFMWYPLRRTIRLLPLRIIFLIGKAGGYLLYFISKDKHSIMAEELSLIMPDKNRSEIRKIIKGSFVNYCVSEIEVLLYPFMNRDFIRKIGTIEGKEHLDSALSKGRGVLLFQAHFGAFQMVMPAIGYDGYKMNQISASASVWKELMTSRIQKKGFDMKAKYELTLPVRHIPVESSLRPVFRALQRNEIVGVTVDGGVGKKVVSIEFLGRNANFPQGAVELAIRTGAVIVPAFIIVEEDFRYRLIIHPPLRVSKALTRDKNIKRILQEFSMILESYVYRHPTHYGYLLYMRRAQASLDSYPFFMDYRLPKNSDMQKI